MVNKWVLFTFLCGPALLSVAGCASLQLTENTSLTPYSLVKPPENQLGTNNYLALPPSSTQYTTKHPDSDTPGYSARIFYSSAETGGKNACSVGDRFDRRGLLAFYSDDRRKRLSFHSGGFDEAMLRYSVKLFSGNKHERDKKTACLYDSPVQGIIGSVYNEIYNREGKNAFDEAIDKIEERGFDFWN